MDKYVIKNCEYCEKPMELKIVTKKGSKNYGKIIKNHQNKRFCSRDCLNNWQKKTTWEERIGFENAKKIRNDRKLQFEKFNPSRDSEEVRKKISESLSKYLKNNPRLGKLNHFYGKHHSEETKKYLKESKIGKCSYDDEQYQKLKQNTLKGENHPNYGNGDFVTQYPQEFNSKLKKEIKQRDNYTCQNCDEKTKKLVIHHINYLKEDYDVDNLISLCCKCHGQTNFNRDSWQIKFNYIIKLKK